MVPSMLGILPYAGVDITIFELLKERLLDRVSGAAGAGVGGDESSGVRGRGPSPLHA